MNFLRKFKIYFCSRELLRLNTVQNTINAKGIVKPLLCAVNEGIIVERNMNGEYIENIKKNEDDISEHRILMDQKVLNLYQKRLRKVL